MRVLLINHFPLFGSGSGVYTANIAKSLIDKGHDVHIIMPENQSNFNIGGGIKLRPVYFYNEEVIKGQLPFNFPCFTTHPRSVNNFFDMTDEEVKAYVDVFDKAIKEEIASFDPDVIHVQHIWILASLACKYDVPVVITAHGTDIIGHEKSDKFHKYTKDAVKKCAHIISISEDNRKLVLKNFSEAKGKLSLMKNGYDEKVFYQKNYDKKEVLKELKITKDYKKIVCFAGKLTHIKGVDLILEAACKYEQEDTATLIAGNGELFEELQKLKKKLGLKNVYFLGNQNQGMLRKIYNISDVSLVPSRYEAFGLVAVEALACSTPVIASSVGGLPSIINEDVGRIIPVENSILLSQNIQNILDKKIVFNREKIATYAHDTYSQDKLIDQLVKIYKKVK